VNLMMSGARSMGLAALVTLLFLAGTISVPGCGSSPTTAQVIERYNQKLRDTVSAKVTDEQRKAQMLEIVDQVETLHLRFSRETADFVASYRKLNADYDSPRAEFEQLFADYNTKRIKARDEALDLHFELASLASASEWEAIGTAEIKLYEKVNAARSEESGK
jgi:hypothetical protein